MAAYGLAARQPDDGPCARLESPAAYYPLLPSCKKPYKENRYPFLSGTPRCTSGIRRPYTDSIYDAYQSHTIPNCTSFKSKVPRFPYEEFGEKDIQELLCRCGLPCECEVEEEKEEVICQEKVRRRLMIGTPPRPVLEGVEPRQRPVREHPSPPFYDTRVKESTEYYRGCKWSKWTSKRTPKSLEVRPGPADYTINRNEITPEEKCYELIRSYKRKNSKLNRAVGTRCDGPSPADYYVELPKGTQMKCLGPLAKRFPSAHDSYLAGPASYSVKRDFELPEPPSKPCHARLPSVACFGSKGPRFRYRVIRGPGPADYNANVKLCKVLYCGNLCAPFNCSAKRFSDTNMNNYVIDDESENDIDSDEVDDWDTETGPRECPPDPTSSFKSRVPRFKPLEKKLDEPSPADLGPEPVLNKYKVKRPLMRQIVAPFLSSKGRFHVWYDWFPVHDVHGTPGPGYYKLEKPQCYPAFKVGPLYRTRRFPCPTGYTPAPNKYNIGGANGAIDNVLSTFNQRLVKNIEKRKKTQYQWIPPPEPVKLSLKQREIALLDKTIEDLSTTDFMRTSKELKITPEPKKVTEKKPKLLRTFLYRKPMPLI